MARKPNTEKLSKDMESALEKALELDLTENASIDDLNIDLSFDDLESQITQAATEMKAADALVEAAPQVNKNNGVKTAPVINGSHGGAEKVIAPQYVNVPAKPLPAPQAASIPVNPPKYAAPARKPEPSTSLPPAANDDSQKNYASALRNLNRRLPNTIFWMTALLSIAWVVASGYAAYTFYGAAVFTSENFVRFAKTPAGLGLLIATVLPVILFWGFAIMVRRAQELRVVAQSMTEVAFRLSEPESLAQDRVMAVGQAVRREVAAMSEGIERTLARASELETLVNGEVHELERVYTDNEIRIRSLVEDLSQEREAIVSHAERVRASISGSHEQLKDELTQASDIIRENVLNASTQLTMTINQSGETLVNRINDSGGQIYSAIGERTDEIEQRLTTSGSAFASLLDTRVAALGQQAEHLSSALANALDSRTEAMVSLLTGATGTLSDTIDGKTNSLVTLLNDATDNLGTVLGGRAEGNALGNRLSHANPDRRVRCPTCKSREHDERAQPFAYH
jgi:hypothetical protein